MSRYPEPREVLVAPLDWQRLTVLELARALATAGVREPEATPLLKAVVHHDGTPEDFERGTTLLYAVAWQLERRIDPAITWAQAQTWRVGMREDTPEDLEDRAVLEAEARASVTTALATGLPPAVAGGLSMAEVGAYNDARARARGPRAGHRRHR